jgi:hypothetical protein
MSETLRRVQTLVLAGDYRVSEHGYEVLAISSERHQAVLVTAYRPDPDLWDSEFKERKR